MVRPDPPTYLALIDWGACGWGDAAHDFAGIPLRAVPFMLEGYREVAPLPEDETAEARILWRHLQIALYLLGRPPQPGLSWAERPAAMLLEIMRFFLGSPGRPWADLYRAPVNDDHREQREFRLAQDSVRLPGWRFAPLTATDKIRASRSATDTVDVLQGSANRISKDSAPVKRMSRLLGQGDAILFARGSKGLISRVALPRLRSVFHVPRTNPSTRKAAGTMPYFEVRPLRYSSAMKRVRSAWERIRLSNSGKKAEPGFQGRASGRRAHRRVLSTLVAEDAKARSETFDHLAERVRPDQVCTSLTVAGTESAEVTQHILDGRGWV